MRLKLRFRLINFIQNIITSNLDRLGYWGLSPEFSGSEGNILKHTNKIMFIWWRMAWRARTIAVAGGWQSRYFIASDLYWCKHQHAALYYAQQWQHTIFQEALKKTCKNNVAVSQSDLLVRQVVCFYFVLTVFTTVGFGAVPLLQLTSSPMFIIYVAIRAKPSAQFTNADM